MQSTEDCSDKTAELSELIKKADAIVIGAGAGLSASAGFTYSGERFHKYFQDFIDEYRFQDMYSGGFYPFTTLNEYWAYWSRYIFINRYMDAPKPVYQDLYKLVEEKDYFVLTTNVDHCFQKAGFDGSRLFYTQGDYGLYQCSEPCCQVTYGNKDSVYNMVQAQGFLITEEGGLCPPHTAAVKREIPDELIPLCPRCGKPMSMNLRADGTFVEEEGWHAAARRYSDFLNSHQKRRLLLLELGTGYNTPGIIKYPFWKMTREWKEAAYACINYGEACVPDEIRSKAVCINEDAGAVIRRLILS